MIDRKWVVARIESEPGVVCNNKFGDDIDVYWLTGTGAEPAMFALLSRHPIARLSLRADPALSHRLRQDYESVLPGQNLNRDVWNTILLTGQLDRSQVGDLIRHSYDLARDLLRP